MTRAAPRLLPDDDHNRRLVAQVHPAGWTNPTPPAGRYNLVAIGGGSAGLVSSIATAGLGGRAALVERHLLGGDCLNFGCVPSKALIAAGHAAHRARSGAEWGVRGDVEVDFGRVMERLRGIRADIGAHDAASRFRDAGVDVHLGAARFVAPDAVEVGGQRLRFARCVIATGARAALPPIPGLAEAGARTNETVFELTALPARLGVIGAGPIGCELAQAFRRLGSAVRLFDMADRVLPRDDPDASALIAERLAAEGVELALGARVEGVRRDGEVRVITYQRAGEARTFSCDELLVAAGRTPNLEGLDLEAAGVEVGSDGLVVDDRLRTTNRRIYAAGDVAGRWQLTHAADAMARIVVQNAMFFGRKRASRLVMPWCTYTDPEVAHVGLPFEELAGSGDKVQVIEVPFEDNDRARCDGDVVGFARFHLDRKGRILAATVVGPHAGELISEVTLAMTQRLTLSSLAGVIHPYPTRAEVIKRAADAHSRERLTPRVAWILRRILAWGRR